MKQACVTGASSGIGRCLALDLAKEGYSLILVARREAELKQLAQEIGAAHPSLDIQVRAFDITDEAKTDRLIEEFPQLDLLINNAGFGASGELHATDWETYQRMIGLNVSALTHLTYRYTALMKKRGSGLVLNMSSLAALGPSPYFSLYAATKSYVLMFSEAIDFELRGSGVRVLAYCPGSVETDFNKVASMSDKSKSMRLTPEEVSRGALQAIRHRTERAVPGFLNKIFAFCYIHFPLLTRRFVSPFFR